MTESATDDLSANENAMPIKPKLGKKWLTLGTIIVLLVAGLGAFVIAKAYLNQAESGGLASSSSTSAAGKQSSSATASMRTISGQILLNSPYPEHVPSQVWNISLTTTENITFESRAFDTGYNTNELLIDGDGYTILLRPAIIDMTPIYSGSPHEASFTSPNLAKQVVSRMITEDGFGNEYYTYVTGYRENNCGQSILPDTDYCALEGITDKWLYIYCYPDSKGEAVKCDNLVKTLKVNHETKQNT